MSLDDLGVHRLRDLSHANTIYQLGHPSLPADFPPVKTETIGNLSEPPHDLLGRETELGSLEEYLRDTGLITFTGFGGTGKTRLAMELGHRTSARFRDGVWHQELAPVTDSTILAKETASLFRVGEDSLSSYLEGKQLLLIVDNCEHILVGTASLVRRLLTSPGVTVIATSREALNLAGEQAFQVQPLSIPEDSAAGGGTMAEFHTGLDPDDGVAARGWCCSVEC